ncbi:MAG: alanine racemase [Pseudomonadota bacterium]
MKPLRNEPKLADQSEKAASQSWRLTGKLSIDLGAIAHNWRSLDALTAPDCETGAVVKANAYGCGIPEVGRALAKAGCRTFFVATPEEGATLRAAVPDALIHILSGYAPGEATAFKAHDLRPILNAPEQVADWFDGPKGPAMLQIDSGMNRLGLEAAELASLAPLPGQITHVMSHLACADVPGHPQNPAQIAAFDQMTAGMSVPLSLAATAGILLGEETHHQLTRPGIGLYGGWPYDDARRVVTVEIPVLQVRDVAPGESCGYGATWVAKRPSRLATISAGYADGLIRALSTGNATGYIAGHPVPFAGRVSMDLITLDVTDAPETRPGTMVELLGPNQSIDDLAQMAGTISHEILTSLGSRYDRVYH